MGNEGYGLKQSVIDKCDYTVKIPMAAGELVVELSESIRSGIQLSAGEEIPEDRLGFINEKNRTYIHRLEEILKM